MTGKLRPLDEKFAIVGPDGKPTLYFTRWAQQRMQDIGNAISEARAEELILAALNSYALQEGLGIDITPDGKLTSNPTISADIQALLNTITSTRGSILFRGASGWQALAPGTAGYFLKTNGAGADPEWAAAGGGAVTPVIRATRPAIYFSSNTVNVPWPAGTVAGDTVYIFTAHGWAASDPAGWTVIRNEAGPFVNGAVWSKVMTAGDIAAGSVTINYAGSFGGTVQAVTIIGSTVLVRSTTSFRSGAGAGSVAFNASPTLANDLIIGYFGNRANSLNALPTGWTQLAQTQNSDASSVFGSILATGTSYTGTATASSGGSGYYTALLSLTG